MKRFGLKSRLAGILATSVSAAIIVAVVSAQPPQRGDRGQSGDGVEGAVKRLMAYDADGNGQLSKTELADGRLQPLLERADANKDGIVTKEELTAQLGKEAAALPRGGPGGGPGFGGPGSGGPPPGDRGPENRAPGNRGPGGPQPGQILPQFLQDELNLTETQRRDLQELQKDVDARLAKILTAEQQQQLQQMRNRGPGPGGPGGPGGRPPRPQ